MISSLTPERFPVELAHRADDGVQVWLFWHRGTNRVFVSVHDSHTGDSFRIEVGGACALDAFHHPYAYAARRGITPGVALPAHGEAVHA
jgi:hypothetical protein